jgi:hypothetical protein
MTDRKTGTHDEWLAARLQLLEAGPMSVELNRPRSSLAPVGAP